MIVRSPWNRKLLPRLPGHKERKTGSYVKVIRMLVGEITTTPRKKTNEGVIVSGRHDLPSHARTFSLTFFEMLNSFAAK